MNDDECDLHRRNPLLGGVRARKALGWVEKSRTDPPRLPSAATPPERGFLGVLILEQPIKGRLHLVSWGLGCSYSPIAGSKVLAVVGPLLVINPLSLGLATFIVALPIVKLAVLARMEVAVALGTGIRPQDLPDA